MENKSTLTYSFSESGDENMFLTLSTWLGETLSKQKVDWRRSYGRATHPLCLKVKILPLTNVLLEIHDLMTRPYFHIFWTDCNSVEEYRSSVKNDITTWLGILSQYKVTDWMIVLVSGNVLSRLTKPKLQLPRMSILDKLKSDFCSKCPERLQVLHEPMQKSSKSAESWSLLGNKVATMTVRCMETVVAQYEDRVRTERERRNEKSWKFCSYFILQEELAFMYEMLGMNDSALVQYDELDAMFTQYVLNANAGDVAHWLTDFGKPIERWHSLLLWRRVDEEARETILGNRASLIDVRNYLFTRLCHILFEMGKVAEVAQRMHDFLHTIVNEVRFLEVKIPNGAIECWVFMCCLELVGALKDKGQGSSENGSTDNTTKTIKSDMSMESLVLQNAGLWNLARLKLYSLGKLCGLLPGEDTTSAQLQTVVDLLGGMGEGEERGETSISPSLILREALSSKKKFTQHYFELSELAMGTFKHMGRLRTAKSIGSDLAEFYLMLGEASQAESYLLDTMRMYYSEGWTSLFLQATKNLAKCYKQMESFKKYLKLCYALMCDKHLPNDEKQFYLDEFTSNANQLKDKVMSVNVFPLAKVSSVRFLSNENQFRVDTDQRIEVTLYSSALTPVTFQNVEISLELFDSLANENNNSIVWDKSSISSVGSKISFQGFDSSHNKKNKCSESEPDVKKSFEDTEDNFPVIQLQDLDHSTEKTAMGKCSSDFKFFIDVADQQDVYKVEDEDVTWSGLTCKHANTLLRRQDSVQTKIGIQTIVPTVILEECTCRLKIGEVTLNHGTNVLKFQLKTDVSGSFILHQLCLKHHNISFVLPRFYPPVSYTVTNRLPTVFIDQGKRLVCGVLQNFDVVVNLGDYNITEHDNHTVAMKVNKNIQLLEVMDTSIVVASDGKKIKEKSSANLEKKSSNHYKIKLPPSNYNNTIVVNISCICKITPTVHTLERKRHQRTHSAPSTRYFHYPKVKNGSSNIKLTNDDRKKETSKSNLSLDKNTFSSNRNNDLESKDGEIIGQKESNQRKKESLDAAPELKLNGENIGESEVNAGREKKNLAEEQMVLSSSEEEEIEEEEKTFQKRPPHFSRHSPSRSTVGLSPFTTNSPNKFQNVYSKNTMHDIVIDTTWKDLPLNTTSLSFMQPLQYNHSTKLFYNSSTYSHIISVIVNNSTMMELNLFQPNLKLDNLDNCKSVALHSTKSKVLKPDSTCQFAWKIDQSNLPLPNILSLQFQVDLASNRPADTENKETSTSVYKFQVEPVLPIYSVACTIEDADKLQSLTMTKLCIKVERLRGDIHHEATKYDQHLVMFQVLDSRGRWAVCGKSNGILGLGANENSDHNATNQVATANLEIMALLPGNLHLPSVVLHRYLKRKTTELDVSLSSTNSPVLKPPRLRKFKAGEVIYNHLGRQILVNDAEEK